MLKNTCIYINTTNFTYFESWFACQTIRSFIQEFLVYPTELGLMGDQRSRLSPLCQIEIEATTYPLQMPHPPHKSFKNFLLLNTLNKKMCFGQLVAGNKKMCFRQLVVGNTFFVFQQLIARSTFLASGN